MPTGDNEEGIIPSSGTGDININEASEGAGEHPPPGEGSCVVSSAEGAGAPASPGSTPPSSAGEQPLPSRVVHSGDIVLHPHAIKA